MARELDISFLPTVARDKLTQLREKRDAALALTRSLQAKIQKLEEELQHWDTQLKQLRKPQAISLEPNLHGFHPQSEFSPPPPSGSAFLAQGLPDSNPQVQEVLTQIASLEYELTRSRGLHSEHQAEFNACGQLIKQLEGFVSNLNGSTALYKGEVESKYKGLVTDAIEAKRRRLRELRADAHRIRSAPIPSTKAKSLIKDYVDGLVQIGSPHRLLDVVEIGNAQNIRPPEVEFHGQLHGGTSDGTPVAVVANIPVPDVMAFTAWLMPDVLLKRLNKEVDELSDDEHALSDQERAAKLKEIASDTLAIEQAEKQKLIISRRTDADPRAVLGLA